MKATTRLIDLILPEFFVFLEDQERLKNMQKGLDIVQNPSIHCDAKDEKGDAS